MTRTLEQVVKDVVGWGKYISCNESECFHCLLEELRTAYEEREKRLPYQIILENGLSEIGQRLERIEEILTPKVDIVEDISPYQNDTDLIERWQGEG